MPAVIDSLAKNYGFGATPGQRLLFGGCSAGAIGAMNTIDAVTVQAAALGVSTVGFLDGAALVDIDPAGWPWSASLIPLQTLVSWLVGMIEPAFPTACALMYPGVESWKCLWSSYRLPLVTTPYFTNAVQFDDFFIQYNTDNLGPHDAAQVNFIDSIQTAYLDLIAALPAGTGIFSPTCLVHCLSGQATYYNYYVTQADQSQVSLSEALDAWFFDQTPTVVVSPCVGWACTEQCGVANWGAAIPCNLGPENVATPTCEPYSLPTSFPSEHAPSPIGTKTILPGTPAPPSIAYTGPAAKPASSGSADNWGGGGGGMQPWQQTQTQPTGSVSTVESIFNDFQLSALARMVGGGGNSGGGVAAPVVSSDSPTPGSNNGQNNAQNNAQNNQNGGGDGGNSDTSTGSGPGGGVPGRSDSSGGGAGMPPQQSSDNVGKASPTDGGETTDTANTGSRALRRSLLSAGL